MANTVSSFYQTVAAAADEAANVLKPTWLASGSVFNNYRPSTATLGQVINVAIPVDPTASVADAGAGDMPVTDIAFNTVPITFDQHPEFAYLIRDWEQYNSAADVRERFLDAALTAVRNYINAKVTALFVTGNFPTNTAITATTGLITTAQFLSGFAVLSDQRVPVANNPTDMSLLLPSVPYTKVLGNATWTDAQVAGAPTAEKVRDTGIMPTAYGVTLKLDQQMPTSGTAGTRTFTAAYFHKYAVAMVTRPLPKPDPKVVEFTYVDFAGIPIRIQMSYQPLRGGWVVIIDAGFGLKVVRENMCQLFSIAEA